MTIEFPQGLSSTEAAQRLASDGANELSVDQHRSLLSIAAEVIREPMFLLLLGAGLIYLAMGDAHEALILLGFVIVIMVVTVLQERRTEQALEALRELSSPRALVIRDAKPQRIAGRDVVVGDILLLSEGDRIAADGAVIEAHELAVDESLLSGETVAVDKFAASSQAYAGCMVVRGQGMLRVSATGAHTELGRIGKSLQDIDLEASPLRSEITRLTRRLAGAGLVLCVILALLYWYLHASWLDGLLAGITLAMGILPQEFPVIMIVFLALGARRIAQQRVLTRRLNAIETLGETTVLCVDKTGTLTQNSMTLASLVVGDKMLELASLEGLPLPEEYHELLEYAVLASEIAPRDPMEQAFHRFAHAFLANTEHLHPQWKLTREYELSAELLAMSHLWRDGTKQHDVVAAKGAPEAIADLCHLPAEARDKLAAQVACMADAGLRVLAVAKASHDAGVAWPALQHDFDFELLGLVGLADPIRAEVPAAVAECRRAGVRVLMMTGDHGRTAQAIAAQAGLDNQEVLRGAEFARLDAEARAQRLREVSVCARVTPQQKLMIVQALKAQGEVVAMTGDGVNDAPALKAAHIGIAMGKRGTDVAREAAALILLEDDFSAIVAAMRLGRRIFANLRQALLYTLAVHVPIIGLAILPVLLGLPVLLTPIHIAFLELVIDPACSVVFEAEEGAQDLMAQAPRAANEALVSARQLWQCFSLGLASTIVVAVFYYMLNVVEYDAGLARALAFVTLVTANALLILSCRSRQPGWRGLFCDLSNTARVVLAATLLALLLITQLPSIAAAFAFVIPSAGLWLLAFALGIMTLAIQEMLQRAWRAK